MGKALVSVVGRVREERSDFHLHDGVVEIAPQVHLFRGSYTGNELAGQFGRYSSPESFDFQRNTGYTPSAEVQVARLVVEDGSRASIRYGTTGIAQFNGTEFYHPAKDPKTGNLKTVREELGDRSLIVLGNIDAKSFGGSEPSSEQDAGYRNSFGPLQVQIVTESRTAKIETPIFAPRQNPIALIGVERIARGVNFDITRVGKSPLWAEVAYQEDLTELQTAALRL